MSPHDEKGYAGVNILYVAHELPFPAVAGHHLRTSEIIAAMAHSAKVHVIGCTGPGQIAASPPGSSTFEAIPSFVRIQKRHLFAVQLTRLPGTAADWRARSS